MPVPQVQAQAVPTIKEFYFDEDGAARPLRVVEGGDEAAMQQLARLMERRQRNHELATAQLGHLALASGRTDTGHSLYQQALAATSPRSTARQTIHWNYGWDLLRQGETDAALGQWYGAVDGRLTSPSWLPPTLAMALWRLDRRDEAVAWFAAAVRTHPDRWPSIANFPALLPGWRDDERATLADVHAAWAADPPAWP
ncbi:tetratricopeptide repeat protein [Luteimonas abyssi]|uniref:tetratricopeptide repeat protein n=1 Tax=Luteimonas abyssi TaxID=1247514 RepID=UPI000737B38F